VRCGTLIIASCASMLVSASCGGATEPMHVAGMDGTSIDATTSPPTDGDAGSASISPPTSASDLAEADGRAAPLRLSDAFITPGEHLLVEVDGPRGIGWALDRFDPGDSTWTQWYVVTNATTDLPERIFDHLEVQGHPIEDIGQEWPTSRLPTPDAMAPGLWRACSLSYQSGLGCIAFAVSEDGVVDEHLAEPGRHRPDGRSVSGGGSLRYDGVVEVAMVNVPEAGLDVVVETRSGERWVELERLTIPAGSDITTMPPPVDIAGRVFRLCTVDEPQWACNVFKLDWPRSEGASPPP
jgi:hypothetical protein